MMQRELYCYILPSELIVKGIFIYNFSNMYVKRYQKGVKSREKKEDF